MKTLIWILVFFFAIVNQSFGQILFQDDFEDGDTVGWVFAGPGDSEWGVLGGITPNNSLNTSIGSNDAHASMLGVAYLAGITTPDHFKMSADVSVVSRLNGPDFGHVGFAWGFDGATYVDGSDIVAQYLRTHSDHVTTFSRPATGESFIPVGARTNDTVYNMMVEVDYTNKLMTFSMDNALMSTLSGVDFDTHILHSGGNLGLINWGEEVTYDNFVLTAITTIPEPSSAFLAPCFIALFINRPRRRPFRKFS